MRKAFFYLILQSLIFLQNGRTDDFLTFREPLVERTVKVGDQFQLQAIVPKSFITSANSEVVDPFDLESDSPTNYKRHPKLFFQQHGYLYSERSKASYDPTTQRLSIVASWEELQLIDEFLIIWERLQNSQVHTTLETYQMSKPHYDQLIKSAANSSNHTAERNAALQGTEKIETYKLKTTVSKRSSNRKRRYDDCTEGNLTDGSTKLSVLPQLNLGNNEVDLKLTLELHADNTIAGKLQTVITVSDDEYSLVSAWSSPDQPNVFYVIFAKVFIQSTAPIKYIAP